MKTGDKTGGVVGALTVRDTDEIMLITVGGQMVRIPVKDIREAGRNTQGVKLVNLDAGDKLQAIAPVISEDPLKQPGEDEPVRKSRRKPFQLPRIIRLPRVTETVVQPAGPALPEFNPLRLQNKSAPVRRQRNVRREISFPVRAISLPARRGRERVRFGSTPTPRAGCRADAILKYCFRFRRRTVLYRTGHANLPLQFRPEKRQRRIGILRQFPAFAAVVIREKSKAAFVHGLSAKQCARKVSHFYPPSPASAR